MQAQNVLLPLLQDTIKKINAGEMEDIIIPIKESRNYHNEFINHKTPVLTKSKKEAAPESSALKEPEDYTPIIYESDIELIEE